MKPTLGQRIFRAANSLTGRTFLILSVGVTAAAVLSLALAEQSRRREFDLMRQGEVATRVQQLAARWDAVAAGQAPRSSLDTILGVQLRAGPAPYTPSPEVVGHLQRMLGPASRPQAGITPLERCLPEVSASELQDAVGNPNFSLRMQCWFVSFRAAGGERVFATLFAPPFVTAIGSSASPVYVAALVAASALLSLLVARLVTRPLQRMSNAAAAFSVSLDAPEAPTRGPTEVRAALSTFNIMQARVREGLKSRTQLLASVSHDLQTPLTRMRLRLEQVEDPQLRDKLVRDVQVMQVLVREGLDLARSHEPREPWSMVDIDSLVGSLAEDAAEMGAPVRVLAGCGANVRVRPNALTRAINNLIDNALKYGGAADISCVRTADGVTIRVRDRGPGLPNPQDPRLFEPFFRGDTAGAAKGAGVGLAIAKAQAEVSGAQIRLSNNPDGGLNADVLLRTLAER